MSDLDGGLQAPQPVEPAAPAPAAAEVPTLPEGSSIQFDGQTVPVSQLVESHRALQAQLANQPAAPAVDPDQMEQFNTFTKAMNGDPDAKQALWDQHRPVPAEPAVQEAPEITALKEQLEAMKEDVEYSRGVSAQIEHNRAETELAGMVTGATETFPNLATHPRGMALVTQRLSEYNALASQRGIDLSTANVQVRQKALEQAFTTVEADIIGDIAAYGGTPKTIAPKGQEIVAVDDQPGNALDGVQRANLTIAPDGTMIDRRTGQAVLGAQTAGAAIPGERLAGFPQTGTPVTPAAGPEGPLTPKNLFAQMRDSQSTI